MFTRLLLKKMMKDIDSDIPLPDPSASGGKLHFNELTVRQIVLFVRLPIDDSYQYLDRK